MVRQAWSPGKTKIPSAGGYKTRGGPSELSFRSGSRRVPSAQNSRQRSYGLNHDFGNSQSQSDNRMTVLLSRHVSHDLEAEFTPPRKLRKTLEEKGMPVLRTLRDVQWIYYCVKACTLE